MALLDFLKSKIKTKTPSSPEREVHESHDYSEGGAKAVARIVLIPCVTEKSSNLTAYNQYCFKAENSATKHQVIDAVRAFWHVHPKAVRVVTMAGRKVRYGRASGKTKDWKKFIVTLREGEKIEIK